VRAGPLIQSIQTLRAIAALAVVCMHIPRDLRMRGYGELPLFEVGAFGVDLFFVISGFIMVYASRHLFAREGASLEFILRRAARIIPTYWLVTSFLIFLARKQILASPDDAWQHIAASYLFIPHPRPSDGLMLPVLPLGWTLNYEMFFYAVFAAALVLPRVAAISAVSVLLLLLAVAGAFLRLPEPLHFWTDSIILEFVFGMLLAEAYIRGFRLPRVAAVLAIAAGIAGAMLYDPAVPSSVVPRGIGWGVPAAAVFAGVVLSASWGIGSSALLHGLGAASYSLYLTHGVVFIFMGSYFRRLNLPAYSPPLLTAALWLAASILVASLVYVAFERPVTRLLQWHVRRRWAASPTPALPERP
jgi:exopolysaccharide production protein ExoZ